MKKLITIGALAAAGVALAGTVSVVEYDKERKAAVTNTYEAADYARKAVQKKAESGDPNGWTCFPQYILNQVDPHERPAVDTILADGRFVGNHIRYAGTFPKMFAAWPRAYAKDCPELVKIAEGVVADPGAWDAWAKNLMIVAYATLSDIKLLSDNTGKSILQAASVPTRHKIRAEGKSFVERNGTNLLQQRIDALSAALNAPRLSGLNDALKSCGMDFGLDFEGRLKPQAEVEEVRTKVLNGDLPAGERNMAMLRTHLGVDEYNKFVRLYNEGE